MTTTENKIQEACEEFVAEWDRGEWMADHGTWASEEYDDAREEYDAALEALREAVAEAPDGESMRDPGKLDSIDRALEALREAAQALDGAVLPGEDDYITEGVIDPDDVADRAVDLDIGAVADGWDCREGWDACRVGTALYIRDWRVGWGNRRSRDLWVEVDADFFADDEAEAVLKALSDGLRAEGYDHRLDGDVIRLSLSAGDEVDGEHPAADEALDDLREVVHGISGDGWDVDWTGDGTTDRDGDDRFDVVISRCD